jgi:hypothetical protein
VNENTVRTDATMNHENSKLVDMTADDGGRSGVPRDLLDPSKEPPSANPAPAALGRQRSAGTSLRNGPTATKMVPELRLQTKDIAAGLRRELKPVGYLEGVLVDEMARHAASMEMAGYAEASMLRFCGQQQAQFDTLLNAEGQIDPDAIVTAAVSNQPIERLGRYRRLHERGFYDALDRFLEAQARRQRTTTRAALAPFYDEDVCREYLLGRARETDGVCPRCGDRNGHWLACGRRECSGCGLQVGLRFGTVMEGSRLPLSIWFIAIGLVLADPTIRPSSPAQRNITDFIISSVLGLLLGTVGSVRITTFSKISIESRYSLSLRSSQRNGAIPLFLTRSRRLLSGAVSGRGSVGR